MNPKIKFTLLVLICVASIPMLYFLSFRKTVQLTSQNKVLGKKMAEYERNKSMVIELDKRINLIESSLSPYYSDSIKIRSKILGVLSSFCNQNNLKICDFPYINPVLNNEIIILTNVATVSGSFKNILRLTHYLEHDLKIARITSINYYLVKGIQDKQKTLQADIYLQNIQRKSFL
jgi:hypothetical protein